MKKVSKTKVEKRMKQKTNPALVKTIIQLKKTNFNVARLVAQPVKRHCSINLGEISKVGKDVLVIGKVLSSGELSKDVKVVGLGASSKAKEKIKKAGGDFIYLSEEMKKNPELKGLEVLS